MRQKMKTTEEWIAEVKHVHGDKYDYSLANYKTDREVITVICQEHGAFKQQAGVHIRGGVTRKGSGCPKCGVAKRAKTKTKKTPDFIRDARLVHGDGYDYSLVDYSGALNKVVIICKEHGEFEQVANYHLNGAGCKKCGERKNALSPTVFIERAVNIHGDKYDYSLVDYKGSKKMVNIVCQEHGLFMQRPNDQLSGCGCPKCAGGKLPKQMRLFLEKHFTEAVDKDGLKKDFLLLKAGKIKFDYFSEKYEDKYTAEFALTNGQKLDFFIPSSMIGIEVNDIASHNSTQGYMGKGEPKPKDYHLNKSKQCEIEGIRLIHAWEHIMKNENVGTGIDSWGVLKNCILHACGKTEHKISARKTKVVKLDAVQTKYFFDVNNINGYRRSKYSYCLVDKSVDEEALKLMSREELAKHILMAYSVGHAHFGKRMYDAEIARGACRLGYSIIGGASKLWNYIINDNPEWNSIVYYVDLNYYNGQSINFLDNVETKEKIAASFWNYWVKEKKIKNREPNKHKQIMELMKQNKIWAVYNAGTQVNVWRRNSI